MYLKDAFDEKLVHEFLSGLSLSSLSSTQLASLIVLITEEEVNIAIRHLSNAKSSGRDGFTAEFYKVLREELSEPLCKLCNHMWQGAPYLDMGREAHIRVIPKKDKDPLQPSSYRPISLINVDSKLLSKIITNRLADILPSLINPNQLGFVWGAREKPTLEKC